MDYSLVVCTYNRAGDLREMLESALALETGGRFEYEIVVVDNNSSDGTRRVVEELLPRGQGRLRYLFEGRQGKSYALNTALAAVRGHTYTIADDDFVLPPDWLVKIHAAFERHPDAAYVSGKVLPLWLGEPPAWLTAEHWGPIAMADYGDAEFFADRDHRICLLACSFRLAPVLAAGGYDVRLGVSGTRTGGTEDLEIQERLWDAGHHGVYAPEISFLHKVAPARLTKRYHRRWHWEHGRSHARMGADVAQRSRLRVLGVPLHFYRRAVRGSLAGLAARLKGSETEAFQHETSFWFCLGFIAARIGDRKQALVR